MNRYIGALFADLGRFENIRYGNALYVLYGDWEEISKRSRIDLLMSRDMPFERFVHSADWQERLGLTFAPKSAVEGSTTAMIPCLRASASSLA